MQKKVLVVAAMLALFVCGGVFAQEAEVPETEAPVAETPETQAPAAESSGGGGGKRPPMYIGVEMGYSSMNSLSITAADLVNVSGHLGGFELVPSFGIAPFSKLPDLALEFNLMMDFMKREIEIDDPDSSDSTITQTTKITVIAPQILAVYTFCEGPVRPFLGAGFGVNINSARFSPGSLKLKLGASFGVVTKAGVVATIPNTKFDLLFLARHNLNISKKMEYEGFSIENLRMNLSTISFVLGGRFNF
ncbi:MAG: hypothetical protein IKK79_07690 [Spirochaetaceae bacterium]|nr:hypothetical protein [Spirochaetaceae bacterium]